MVNPGITPLSVAGDLPLGHRFGVFLFAGGIIPNPIDIMFQKVSGLACTVKTDSLEEGGQVAHPHALPNKIEYSKLQLTRGLLLGSPLVGEFNAAMSLLQFHPSNVLVTLYGNTRHPVAAWLLMKAFPVGWSVSGLDAESNSVVIEEITLHYQHMQVMRI